jgi:preprotein translocase subunit SecD
LILNGAGARLFEQITAANVNVGLPSCSTTASIRRRSSRNGSAAVGLRFTGNFDIKEARDLSIVLRAGALPAPVEILEERDGGAFVRKRFDSPRRDLVRGRRQLGYHLYDRLLPRSRGHWLTSRCYFTFCSCWRFWPLSSRADDAGIAGIVLICRYGVDANVLINERIP